MKQLTLIRHAQASAASPGQSDFDRPLSPAGKKQLPDLRKGLDQQLKRPDRLIYSGARRTLETSQPLAIHWNLSSSRYLQKREIYEAPLNSLLLLLQEQPDDCNHLILVGHNPGIAELLAFLSGTSIRHYPPAAWAKLDLHLDHWTDLSSGCATLQTFEQP